MLEIKRVSINYNNRVAVKDVSLTVEERQIVGIVGESGSGKTTLVRSIAGLLDGKGSVRQGEILLHGQNLLALPDAEMRQLRGCEIGMIFQHPDLTMNPIWTIEKLFYESMSVHATVTKREARERGTKLLRELALNDAEQLMDSYPFELSGGMCQRAAIAIAMINRPGLLLADEPTSALDVTVQSQVMESMLQMREIFGTSILIVSHNMGVIAKLADRVGVMYRGELVEWGEKDEVLSTPKHEYTKSLLNAVPKMKSTCQNQKGALL